MLGLTYISVNTWMHPAILYTNGYFLQLAVPLVPLLIYFFFINLGENLPQSDYTSQLYHHKHGIQKKMQKALFPGYFLAALKQCHHKQR